MAPARMLAQGFGEGEAGQEPGRRGEGELVHLGYRVDPCALSAMGYRRLHEAARSTKPEPPPPPLTGGRAPRRRRTCALRLQG